MSTKKVINNFRGEYSFLSNFYSAKTVYEGVEYKTSEHAFQAAKSLRAEDREMIRKCAGPVDAKRKGYEVELRKDWNDIRLQVMEDCLRSKFSNTYLRNKLLDTGDAELIEGNTWNDNFWGVCDKEKGQNHLGKILMKLRDEFRKVG